MYFFYKYLVLDVSGCSPYVIEMGEAVRGTCRARAGCTSNVVT